jgi:hypothetical protein
MSSIHASGFHGEGQKQIPMRVMKILDQVTVKHEVRSFVPILFNVCYIVRKEYPTASVWHATDIVVEVLNHIGELQPLSGIFESSAEHALQQLEDRRRECSVCAAQ